MSWPSKAWRAEQPEQSEGEDTAEAVDFGSTSTMNAAELEAGMTAVNLTETDPADEDVDVEGLSSRRNPSSRGRRSSRSSNPITPPL